MSMIDFKRLRRDERRRFAQSVATEPARATSIAARDDLGLTFPPWTFATNTNTSSAIQDAETTTDAIVVHGSALQCVSSDSFDRNSIGDANERCDVSSLSTIYYQESLLTTSFHDALLDWLNQLPTNSTGATATATTRPTESNADAHIRATNGQWTYLPHAQRRVAVFDGVWMAGHMCPTRVDASNETSRDAWFPPPLLQLVDWMVASSVVSSLHFLNNHELYSPNHMLINQYPDAASGILPHTDGPAYAPWTLTLSLGSGSVLLYFTPRPAGTDDTDRSDTATSRTVLLHGGGSAILFAHDAYTHHCHSIVDVREESMMERTDPTCLNAPPDTIVTRAPHRTSITIRHKRVIVPHH